MPLSPLADRIGELAGDSFRIPKDGLSSSWLVHAPLNAGVVVLICFFD